MNRAAIETRMRLALEEIKGIRWRDLRPDVAVETICAELEGVLSTLTHYQPGLVCKGVRFVRRRACPRRWSLLWLPAVVAASTAAQQTAAENGRIDDFRAWRRRAYDATISAHMPEEGAYDIENATAWLVVADLMPTGNPYAPLMALWSRGCGAYGVDADGWFWVWAGEEHAGKRVSFNQGA